MYLGRRPQGLDATSAIWTPHRCAYLLRQKLCCVSAHDNMQAGRPCDSKTETFPVSEDLCIRATPDKAKNRFMLELKPSEDGGDDRTVKLTLIDFNVAKRFIDTETCNPLLLMTNTGTPMY